MVRTRSKISSCSALVLLLVSGHVPNVCHGGRVIVSEEGEVEVLAAQSVGGGGATASASWYDDVKSDDDEAMESGCYRLRLDGSCEVSADVAPQKRLDSRANCTFVTHEKSGSSPGSVITELMRDVHQKGKLESVEDFLADCTRRCGWRSDCVGVVHLHGPDFAPDRCKLKKRLRIVQVRAARAAHPSSSLRERRHTGAHHSRHDPVNVGLTAINDRISRSRFS